MPLINAHADVSIAGYVKGLNFGLSFHLRPYLVFSFVEELRK